MLYVTACHAGVFVLNEDLKIVDYKLFPKEANAIAERLHVLKKGQLVPELEEALAQIKDSVVTDLNFEYEGMNVEHKEDNPGSRFVQENVRELAITHKFVSDASEWNLLLAEVARLQTRTKMRTRTNKDRFVGQAVAAIEDLTEITNLMSERLHEWYGLYHPELERKIRDNEKYAQQIVEGAKRDEDSIGASAAPEDLEAIKLHAAETVDLFALKRDYEQYLEQVMPGVAPNTTTLAGPVLAARLIKHAGSLERLAKLPASTIQLLGAEKALFRFMKQTKAGGREAARARPPKYGLLFNHPYVQRVPQDKKGKVARALAAKLSMAAKTDFYSGEDRSAMYAADLERKLKDIGSW